MVVHGRPDQVNRSRAVSSVSDICAGEAEELIMERVLGCFLASDIPSEVHVRN